MLNEQYLIDLPLLESNNKSSNTYPKDEETVIVYEYAGISHYVMPNKDKWAAVWSVENVECSIITNNTENELYEIVKSIYQEEK